MAYDLARYGPFGTYTWRVPFDYLDREGARAWLRSYFDGDGEVYVREGRLSDSKIGASSVSEQGLREVQKLLSDYFGIVSNVYPHWKKKPLM